MNSYVGLTDLKSAVRVQSTSSDAELMALAIAASRGIDAYCARHFYDAVVTRYFTGDGGNRLILDRAELVSVTSVALDLDGDGTYETALVEDTDFWGYPYNESPIWRLDLRRQSTQVGGWPTGEHSIKVVGLEGYPSTDEAAGTLGAAISSTTATSITMTAGHSVQTGLTLELVSGEQVYVSAVSTNTLTVTRGVNGTTAATQASGSAVVRRRFDPVIERATIMQVTRMRQDQMTGGLGQVGDPNFGGFSVGSLYPMVRDMLNTRRRAEAGVR